MSGSGASTTAAIPTAAATMPPMIPSTPVVTSAAIVTTALLAISQPLLTAIPTDALNALTAAIYAPDGGHQHASNRR
jgi:hypothetical protein